ncbi:Tim17/Tim22/Tim23/Pmp24 family-domain-containing protein [Myxozyma melibiosi]|uniref:Tim17/Tim22/Tim23/Pmp24 family-domain-containing protein n=1 Tax=Myxozyma melibiosi TaxID=54550 RepID=A0ABR1F8L3_9ASCO
MENIIEIANSVALDPKYHDVLEVVKGVRNGAVYGAKIRFPHALVMTFLFRNGTPKDKLRIVLKATRDHAKNLATFVFIYKSVIYVLKSSNPEKKSRDVDALIGGLIGGYYVFGRGGKSSVNQQIVLYVFSRVAMGLAKLAVKKNVVPISSAEGKSQSWNVFATLCWGIVMYLFRTDPDVLQVSMKNSMDYLYLDSNHWTSMKTLLWHNK